MAAGVGKTYRMLQEGQAEAEAGRDVGHRLSRDARPGRDRRAGRGARGRAAPAASSYRGTTLEEMDLPALLERAPELALIDELAHTNAPGLEHAKRYEDVEDVLDAGIDVFSTVNVQHLESLNDQVAELTGVRVRETFPDEVLGRADEVVLRRPHARGADRSACARARSIPPSASPAALNGFFKVENLQALREVALRQVAEDVEAKRLARDTLYKREERCSDRPLRRSRSGCWPRAARRARRAGRAARVALVPATRSRPRHPGRARPARVEPSAKEREQLEALRRLAAVLGAALFVEEGEDVARGRGAASRASVAPPTS